MLIDLAAFVIGAAIVWLLMRRTIKRLEAEHKALATEHENLAIAYGLLTDRDEQGRFKK